MRGVTGWMENKAPILEGMTHADKLQLLEDLLNDLQRRGVISPQTLFTIASDVMELDYREDEELICFGCLDHENEEE